MIQTTPTTNNSTQPRIDYLDIAKGVAILWIVWWHTCHPHILDPYYHVPFFFFVSGIFFKSQPFVLFVKKKISKLLVPFIFFYLISYPYRIIVYLWDHRTLEGFPWNTIFDVFRCMPNGDYLFVNVPLWFLLCLFNINILYYYLEKTPQWFKWTFIVLSLFLSDFFQSISTPFFINEAFRWTVYFALGALVGPQLLKTLENKKNAFITFAILLTLFILLHIFLNKPLAVSLAISSLTSNILTLSFIFMFVAFFSFFDGTNRMKLLKHFGQNSIIVLGIHVPILIIFQRIVTKYWGGVNQWGGFAVFLATTTAIHFIIPIFNKAFPKFIGKQDIFPKKKDA